MVKRTLLFVAAALAGGAPMARAADLGPLYGQAEDTDALPPPDFTLGTGWYLRGDLAASDDIKPAVLGTLGRTERRDWNYGIGGGVGYKFTDILRADLTGEYLGDQRSSHHFNESGVTYDSASNLRRFDVMANAYADLGTWAGFTPYVGAGIGVSGVRLDGSYDLDAPTIGYHASRRVSGSARYDLAWAAMAGVSYNVSQNLIIDIGYRYLDLGTYEVPHTLPSFAGGLKADLNAHQIRAGIRYMIY